MLNQLYTKNKFANCKETFMSVNNVPEVHVTIRECAREESHLGGQGFKHRNCTGECNSNRCKCKKSNVLCNLKCRNSFTCKNK